jgi:hypothetical protein
VYDYKGSEHFFVYLNCKKPITIMLTSDQISDLFFLVDEYCIHFEKNIQSTLTKLPHPSQKFIRNKSSNLSSSEVITILIAFHHSDFRTLKHFYKEYVCVHMSKDFPQLVSYNRFVELHKLAALPLLMFVSANCLGDCTGFSFIDSTKLAVCKNQRIKQHRQFKEIAQREDTHQQDGFLGLNFTLLSMIRPRSLTFSLHAAT